MLLPPRTRHILVAPDETNRGMNDLGSPRSSELPRPAYPCTLYFRTCKTWGIPRDVGALGESARFLFPQGRLTGITVTLSGLANWTISSKSS